MTFFIDNKYAFRFEHPAYTAAFTKVTTLFRECMAHVCSSTITIIGHHLNSNGNTGRTITFVYDFFICIHVRSTDTFVDSTLNVILRDIIFTSFLQSQFQTHITSWICTTHACCNGNFTTDFCSQFSF